MSDTGLVIAVVAIGVALVMLRVSALDRRLDRIARVEAKLDALLKGQGVNFDPYRDVPPGVREALDGGDAILAIKRFREATGAGLTESKDFVDELRRRSPTTR